MSKARREGEATAIERALVQQLESLERAGVTHLPKPRRRAKGHEVGEPAPRVDVLANSSQTGAGRSSALPSPRSAGSASPESLFGDSRVDAPAGNLPASGARVPVAQLPSLPLVEREAALAAEAAVVAKCTRCKVLAETRTQTVYGIGSPRARLCFLGEAPGADEDRLGEPFVGRAGQLLTRIIEACTLRREDVYIFNTLKCRPPDNRKPLDDELANCRGYLERQLEIIRPEFLCCLGATAAETLLETKTSVGKLRGRFHDYRGITVVVTYHPSYLLRNPAAKKEVWDDMQMLMKRMGIALPQK